MYPVLVATGGLTTLLVDFRHRILSRLRPRRRRTSSTPSRAEGIELQAIPSTQVDELAVPPLARTRDAGNAGKDEKRAEEEDREGGKAEQGLRQRHQVAVVPTPSTVQTEAPPDNDERLRTRLIVPPAKVAYTLGASFIVLVITLVVLRAKYPVKPVPRALDFTTNMVIAGVIIFGGGPVVSPFAILLVFSFIFKPEK